MFLENRARLISLSHHVFVLYKYLMGLRYQEYIGTPGCSSSPGLCDQWLNSSKGKDRAAGIKTLANIGVEDSLSWDLRGKELRLPYIIYPHRIIYINIS